MKSPDVVVRLNGVSKAYKLASTKKTGNIFSSIFGKSARNDAQAAEVFWALRDVSLEVPAGSMVGVLGLNGAGKSTFLKLVAGMLQASDGVIERSGSVAMIELGAGFNQHMSARENVRMLGRQQGLSPTEIDEKIRYVEEFADIGIFFDQPMHSYSSGMQSRVGFGNAFSGDPDLLIVDEALSVGDASFSNKCFRRIEELRAKGKSILFASHDRDTVARLCDMGVVFHHGEMVCVGSAKDASLQYERIVDQESTSKTPNIEETSNDNEEMPVEPANPVSPIVHSIPEEVVRDFLESTYGPEKISTRPGFNAYEDRFGSGAAEIVDYQVAPIKTDGGKLKFPKSSSISILFKVLFHRGFQSPVSGIEVKNKEGVLLFGANTMLDRHKFAPVEKGDIRVFCINLELALPSAQEYFVSLGVADGVVQASSTLLDKREALILFSVEGKHNSIGVCDLPVEFSELTQSLSLEVDSPSDA